jgi:hypothetical protein
MNNLWTLRRKGAEIGSSSERAFGSQEDLLAALKPLRGLGGSEVVFPDGNVLSGTALEQWAIEEKKGQDLA